jgi:3-deoxy-D-manno-octulosonate 8-phosphate phosphatase (KDO 8-P phosphatase)
VAYIGDDLPDLTVIQRVGWGVAVADAVPELKQAAAQVTSVGGGCGAVREVIEGLLKARGMWEGLIQKYSAS